VADPDTPRRGSLGIGAGRVAATVAFEFGFVHRAAGSSWRELSGDDDVTDGHVWPLLLLWLLVGPAVIREVGSTPEAWGTMIVA
jgi:hypothetical protein